jgi:16S rRNA (cytidine1402-2'-O)-methyltransferase
MTCPEGILYVVATPIGNLGDMTARAIRVLGEVDLILAEDTRHSGRLLAHLGIATPMRALHEHNEKGISGLLVRELCAGRGMALISDAGTPLLSDPGFVLVREARAAGVPVRPVPGACALTAALSVAGLPTDRFVFEGFLPSRREARRSRLQALAGEPRTLVFYEAPHRLAGTLADLRDCFGGQRRAVLARELTKAFETVIDDCLEGLSAIVEADPSQRRGEMVLLVHGAEARAGEAEVVEIDSEALLRELVKELPVSRAAALAARITGLKKNRLYRLALTLGRPDSTGRAGADE